MMTEREQIFQFKQNAKYFAKSKGTIGDMERAVGVSPGYLSRDLKQKRSELLKCWKKKSKRG